jgi:hypothetical protein
LLNASSESEASCLSLSLSCRRILLCFEDASAEAALKKLKRSFCCRLRFGFGFSEEAGLKSKLESLSQLQKNRMH